eukprot:jgi/Botrbrau1/20886/Bobra.0135s0017.1
MRVPLYGRARNSLSVLARDALRCIPSITPHADVFNVRNSTYKAHSSVDAGEVEKFRTLAASWWDVDGASAFLHRMNPVRAAFIRDTAVSTFRQASGLASPLTGLSILDVGCGGGLLSESLARMGAHVTGIDAAPEAVTVATQHAALDPAVQERTTYLLETAEGLVVQGRKFNVVVASEVIEHVRSPREFSQALAELTTFPGAIVVSTLNRTPRAYALAILGAEYLLQVVSPGTHDWRKFITPEELVMMMSSSGAELERLSGMVYNPLTSRWSLSTDTAVNYIAAFQRKGSPTSPLSPSEAPSTS